MRNGKLNVEEKTRQAEVNLVEKMTTLTALVKDALPVKEEQISQ